MNIEKPQDLAVCPECGAALPLADAKCWLCGRPNVAGSWSKSRPAAARPTGLEVAATITLSTLLVSVAAVMMFSGLVGDAPGLAILFAAVVTPGLLATWLASKRARAKGESLAWYSKLAAFMISTAITVGMLGVLCVAAFVAFFIWCLFALSTGQMH
jgi:hypothetical protein